MNLLEDLQAEREIHRLLAVYNHHADDFDGAGWSGLFTEGGSLVAGGREVTGAAALQAWLQKIQQSIGATRHVAGNIALTHLSPTEATGVVDMLVYAKAGEQWVVRNAPRYTDRYVRTADGWRFARREIAPR